MNFDDNIEIPSDDEVAVDGPKKKKNSQAKQHTLLIELQENIESKDKKEV